MESQVLSSSNCLLLSFFLFGRGGVRGETVFFWGWVRGYFFLGGDHLSAEPKVVSFFLARPLRK